jgi:preprotein translocase subunit Sss1
MREFVTEYVAPVCLTIAGICCVILLIGFTIVVIRDMLNN